MFTGRFMIKTSFLNQQKLPLVIEPTLNTSFESLVETANEHREFLHEQLLRHGAILLRGFQMENTANFEKFARVFSEKELFNYAGGVSPRRVLSDGVYTSTEYPSQFSLSLHNELSYSNIYPNLLFFGCLIAPQDRGETTLGDSRRILQKIDRQVLDVFKSKQLCYVRNLQADKGSGYSWQEAFESDDAATVEETCRKAGADFEWKANGGLRVSQIRPAILTHPITTEEVWFNQADGFHSSNLGEELLKTLSEDELRLNVYFGDGSLIESEMLAHIRRVLQSETISHRWQVGDILILDNILSAHGRMPFTGARKIILAMT
jgi:alpha-ketoglutarate-dependent taurine dioxygenase